MKIINGDCQTLLKKLKTVKNLKVINAEYDRIIFDRAEIYQNGFSIDKIKVEDVNHDYKLMYNPDKYFRTYLYKLVKNYCLSG